MFSYNGLSKNAYAHCGKRCTQPDELWRIGTGGVDDKPLSVISLITVTLDGMKEDE